MNRNLIAVGAVLALAGFTAACSSGPGPATPSGGTGKSGETKARADASHPKDANPDWWHSEVTITNASSWAIHQVFLTPFDKTEWGQDQLDPDEIIKSGEALKLTKLTCDTYDIKLVDEQGDTCIVQDVDLCLQNATWKLDDTELVGCEVSTAVQGHADTK